MNTTTLQPLPLYSPATSLAVGCRIFSDPHSVKSATTADSVLASLDAQSDLLDSRGKAERFDEQFDGGSR